MNFQMGLSMVGRLSRHMQAGQEHDGAEMSAGVQQYSPAAQEADTTTHANDAQGFAFAIRAAHPVRSNTMGG